MFEFVSMFYILFYYLLDNLMIGIKIRIKFKYQENPDLRLFFKNLLYISVVFHLPLVRC